MGFGIPNYTQIRDVMTRRAFAYLDSKLGDKGPNFIVASGAYTALPGDAVVGTGSFTVTLNPVAGSSVRVANKGTGVITVTTSSGVIRGTGLLSAGAASATLAFTGNAVDLVSDGTDWFVVGGGFTVGWTTLAPATGWAFASILLQYMRDVAGMVHLRGEPSTIPAPGVNTTVSTLPAGFRPSGSAFIPITAFIGGNLTPCSISVSGAGVISENFSGAVTAMDFNSTLYLAEA